ncbi:DUF1513 domain-containing protein [Marinobacter halodurans]|uniref:DUF1513 domain-containing protein n=1 Tax=Marinobacter halodurans TaxID=2528979 RepID=A0ABY1ZIB7_9GAMM|nr:DUF1513 domain-containing protein [Marinobacter halodurans]
MNRRQFLQASLATLVAGSLDGRLAFAGADKGPLILSAVDDETGHHLIAGVDLQGRQRFLLPVGNRCHGGCERPGTVQAILFARRPGRHVYVVDTGQGNIVHDIAAGDGYHFYGHGVFSPDSRYLYVTVNRYDTGEGIVRVYDAEDNYRAVRDMPVGGIGPHELVLHPDGNTLIVALGGIQTHPDYDRIKLNPDTMQPALLLMDRQTGGIRKRFRPSHHQLSCRHLGVSPDGIVVAGYQYQGPTWESRPLIAHYDSNTDTFREIGLPKSLQRSLHNYVASVAVSPASPLSLVTAPRGDRVVVINHRTRALVSDFEVPDVAGALALPDGSFVVSSGTGSLHHISADGLEAETVATLDIHWDNHLTFHG